MSALWCASKRWMVLGLLAIGVVSTSPVWSQARNLPDFTDLVDQVGPSVVNIRTLEKVQRNPEVSGPDDEMQELLRRFFGVPIPGPRPGAPVPRSEEHTSELQSH